MTDDTFPPLPAHAFALRWHDDAARYTVNKPNIGNTDCYTDDQMRAYGAACADAAIERCAQVCEEIEASAWALWKLRADPTEQGRNIGAQHCADAIRALKGQPT
jgi:hypothetical protein